MLIKKPEGKENMKMRRVKTFFFYLFVLVKQIREDYELGAKLEHVED